MCDINAPFFNDEDAARVYLEGQRWPEGPVCPHCGAVERIYPVKADKQKKIRKGLFQCNNRGCEQQFTVTVGTVFERSKIPLHKWLMATYLMSSSKKGISAKQLERTLGITYKSAWFMAHRIREAILRTEALVAQIATTREYLGAVFGKIHALFKESEAPHFTLRQADSNDLVRCFYQEKDYEKIVDLLRNKDSYIHVGGRVSANLINNKIDSIKAEKYRVASHIADSDIRKLKGSIPNLTGDLGTEDYVDWLRNND